MRNLKAGGGGGVIYIYMTDWKEIVLYEIWEIGKILLYKIWDSVPLRNDIYKYKRTYSNQT